MSVYWSELVHRLTPYVPGEQPKLQNLVKLNTNENPFGPSPKVLAALQAEASESLRLYPDPDSSRLKSAIAEYYGLQANQVFVGNGSDEVLAHVFQALLKHDQPLLFPDISYSFYPVYCGLYGIEFETVPLNAQFEIAIDDYLRPNGGIIFPNPNAPTGVPMPLSDVERLLKANTHSVVVVDEAYVDFGTQSAVSLVNQYPNLLVTHTYSKSRSLAGLRVGYALGNATLIQALIRIKDSFNSYPLDRFAEAGAIAAIQDEAYFEQTRQQVIVAREALVADLQSLGFEVLPSGANFIFAKHPKHAGEQLAAGLRDQAVIVRHFKKPARILDFLRITIGNPSQNQALMQALRTLL
ncbi:histidinol-phosphate transaminase [Methylophilus medardicus]|uniref:Histidinol-phosphate aminotransferase n=1 Tax=Methylophilus medardicus TaxID=2588534 RepID=A0A5B8CQI2_9PROT|nr:histidinol-phosphate transaminase [Methylophilus medardicus]QDC43326.1 histidinol-phosphate transaminase [Methylophilus medardicus]QDC48333.1 histidinol-phosphate transaminase [Methylophilus medardicus]QDC52038.1 histidinol-phosphate transaminase [Methylophilus medardicus]